MKSAFLQVALFAGLSVVSAGAATNMVWSFDAGLEGFGVAERGTPAWTSSVGNGSAQANGVGNNWAWTIKKSFDAGEIANIAELAGLDGKLSFDIVVDHGTSFGSGGATTSDWFQINIAGNSSPGSWSQIGDIFNPDGWHNAGDTARITKSFTMSLSSLGITPSATWLELQWGQNSGTLPVNYYLDNVSISSAVTPVPEPGTVGLCVLGALALGTALRRRRR